MEAKPCDPHRQATLKFLIWAFRCLGLLCFKASPSASSSAEISLPALLYTLFLKTFNILITIPVTVHVLGALSVLDVGTLTRNLTFAISTAFHLIGEVTLISKGQLLCQIISECNETAAPKKAKRGNSSWQVFSVEIITTLLFYCSYVVSVSSNIYSMWSDAEISRVERVVIIARSILYKLSVMLTAVLFRELLSIASERLYVDSSLGESLLQSGDAESNLDALSRTIHKVSVPCKLFGRMTHSQ